METSGGKVTVVPAPVLTVGLGDLGVNTKAGLDAGHINVKVPGETIISAPGVKTIGGTTTQHAIVNTNCGCTGTYNGCNHLHRTCLNVEDLKWKCSPHGGKPLKDHAELHAGTNRTTKSTEPADEGYVCIDDSGSDRVIIRDSDIMTEVGGKRLVNGNSQCLPITNGTPSKNEHGPTMIPLDNNNAKLKDGTNKSLNETFRLHYSLTSETSDFSELTDYPSDSSSPGIFSDGDDDSSDMLSLDGSMTVGQNGLRAGKTHRVSHASVCIDHSPQRKSLFCLDCERPVCLECKVGTEHGDHKATTLGNAATECRNKLKILHRELACQNTNLNNSLVDNIQYQERLKSNKLTIMNKLKARRNYLHRLIDRWHGKMQLRVDVVFSHEMERVRIQIEEITWQMSELREELEYLTTLLAHKQAADVLALSKELLSMREDTMDNNDPENSEQLNLLTASELYFMFNSGSDLSYSDFGDFTVGRVSNSQMGAHLVVSSGKLNFSFDTRLGEKSFGRYSATGLALIENGNFLVTDLGLDQVQIFRPNGQRIIAVDTLPGDEPSTAVPFGGSNILVACRTGLKLYSRDGMFGRRVWPDVECPNGLHVRSTDQELIVTDHAHDGPFVHLFDTEEMVLKNSIIGGTRAPMFHQPWYVTSDTKGQIIITDSTEHNVKIFTPRGVPVNEFGGQGAQAGLFFRPAGVCVDRFGHILVADSGNNRVQMFTSAGQFCAILLANSNHELQTPMDLVIDDYGNLVVLQANGILSTYQYIY